MNKISKPAKKYLTPYQLVEHEIREASNDAGVSRAPRRTSAFFAKENDSPAQSPSAQTNKLQSRNPGSTGSPTDDDLAAETLIHEDGARSPFESGGDIPADRTYRVVERDEAGGTFGLDEAELAHIDPLDGEPWDPLEEDSLTR